MTLDEIIQIFTESGAADWSEHIGHPTFLYGPPDADDLGHYARVVYKPDISIGLAWGSEENDRYQWDWVNTFPDKSARSVWIDLLHNGQPVFREIAVVVDGGRATLPSPLPITDEDGREIRGWKCERQEYEFVRAFARATGDQRNFDEYFARSGIQVSN